MDFVILFVALVTSFVAMFFGAVSGGVGLALRPVLVFFGIPPHILIGSLRISSVVGEIPGMAVMHRKRMTDWSLVPLLALAVFIGGTLASILVVTALREHLAVVMGVLLLVFGSFIILNPQFGTARSKSRLPRYVVVPLVFIGAIGISFMSIFTGGLGPLYSSLYIWGFGKTYTEATAIGRPSAYIGGLGALVVFLVSGVFDWTLCLVLAVGLGLGSYFGTHHALKKGDGWVRIAVLVVVIVGALTLLLK